MDFRYFIGIDIAKDTAAADRPRLGRLHSTGFATQHSHAQHTRGHQGRFGRVEGPAWLESQTGRLLHGAYGHL